MKKSGRARATHQIFRETIEEVDHEKKTKEIDHSGTCAQLEGHRNREMQVPDLSRGYLFRDRPRNYRLASIL
jgi:hypothetical protein